MAPGKDPDAFKTIGELSEELGVAQHILRYWETKFPQLRPLQRAGNRRYYRPADVALTRRIHRLLNEEGYTVRGVQKLLGQRDSMLDEPPAAIAPTPQSPPFTPNAEPSGPRLDVDRLIDLRNRLADALNA